jgi:hypothetical protein
MLSKGVSPRGIRSAREHGADETATAVQVYQAIMLLIAGSRASLDASAKALDMARQELDDKQAEKSLSWADGRPRFKRGDQ